MSQEQMIVLDNFQENAMSQIVPSPTILPILSSDRAGWRNIHLVHFYSPDIPWETPDYYSQQHIIGIPTSISYPVNLDFKYNSDRQISKCHWHPR